MMVYTSWLVLTDPAILLQVSKGVTPLQATNSAVASPRRNLWFEISLIRININYNTVILVFLNRANYEMHALKSLDIKDTWSEGCTLFHTNSCLHYVAVGKS